MKVAIVVLNWNGVQLLEKFLPSIVRFSSDANIYVADNASTDNSVAYVKDHFPTVKIVQNEANYGFAKGYNEALKHIEADVYALVNSDIEVTNNWLSPVIDKFESDSDAAIIQPKILDYKNKTAFEYAGAAGGFIDKYGFPFCRGRIFETVEIDSAQYDNDVEIFWASGACFFIRAKVFNELGGFDDDFFAHQEEIDLCWRARNASYKANFVANSVVYHVGGATLKHGNPHKTYLNFRNSLFMLIKNLPAKKLYPILFGRMLFDGIAGIKFLLEVKPAHFYAILRAHFAMYRSFSKMKNKRQRLQRLDYYSIKSIVSSYYFARKTKYNEMF